ncbi:MAG: BREX system Lon protease-like protein BrxL [Chloroflexota bacterium]|nr:BREX system Lon protease-like protein BrxL [Chloroflexota bacterium]
MDWTQKLAERFPDKIVNKGLTRRIMQHHLPRFVTEYLLARYAYRGKEEALRVVNQLIRDYYPEPRHAERVVFEMSEQGSRKLLGFFAARFDESIAAPLVRTPLLGKRDMRISRNLPREYPILLEGGAWGLAEVHYEPDVEVNGRQLPFFISTFAPFQVARLDMDDYYQGRRTFDSEEWLAVLMSTLGLNPKAYTRQETLYVLSRFLPLVESNINLIELGPRGTGKTYGLRNISPYSFVLSGGKATAAQLFLDLRSHSVGVIARKDVVVFDEIAYAKFDARRDNVLGILKDYMASGVFSRGGTELPSECGIFMVGNTDHGTVEAEDDPELQELLADDVIPGEGGPEVDDEAGTMGERYLYQSLPEALHDTALFDRIHGFVPGWRIPKLGQDSFSEQPGFIADYFSEVLHRLRWDDHMSKIRARLDLHCDGGNLTTRDEESLLRNIDGFVKLVYPDGRFTDAQLLELGQVACDLRNRIVRQQHVMELTRGGRTVEFPDKKLWVELR